MSRPFDECVFVLYAGATSHRISLDNLCGFLLFKNIYIRIYTTIIDIIIIAVHCTIKYDHSSGMAIEILLVFSV